MVTEEGIEMLRDFSELEVVLEVTRDVVDCWPATFMVVTVGVEDGVGHA